VTGGVIRTVGGDLPSDIAGPTYAHEHLIIDSPLVAESMPHIHLPSIDEAVAEVRQCIASGVRTMVDAMPAASGRDPARLGRVSVLSGMRVVASTGLHTSRYYESVPWTEEETPEQLAGRFVADIEEGIDAHDYRGATVERTDVRAGVVKAGALTERLSPRDERLFEAVAMTVRSTGVPVLTHTEGGSGGPAQIELLGSLGVPLDRVAVSHTDKVPDTGYHQSMLETGVFLCYDQGLRQPEVTLALVDAMVALGFADQILMGTDGARRTLWSTLGGSPGLSALYETARASFDAEVVHKVFVANPARYLTLTSWS